jgi:hypothetical protein
MELHLLSLVPLLTTVVVALEVDNLVVKHQVLAVAVQQTQMVLQTQAVALEELMVDKQPLVALV